MKTRTNRVALSLNGYFMNYRNQLVLNGAINDVGAFNRVNVPNSYRAGVEIDAAILLTKALRWNVNGTFSQNKIRNYTQFFDTDSEQETRQYAQTDIAFSPNVIAGSQLLLAAVKGLEIGLLSKYVGPQFLDNTSSNDRKLNAYLVNDLRVIYTVKPTFAQEITFTLLVNNLLGERYESNGYTYVYGSENRLDSYNYYYPQAGRNILAGVRVKL